MLKSVWILMGVILFTPPAFSVSRVGTGKVSNEETGFVASVPPQFPQVIVSASQDFILRGRPMIHSGFSDTARVFMFLLSNQQPQWLGRSDRQEFRDQFFRDGWSEIGHAENCVQQFEKDSGSGLTRVLSWGDGLGLVISAPNAEANSVRWIADSLHIEEGFCRWR